jgi:hypothetical protein
MENRKWLEVVEELSNSREDRKRLEVAEELNHNECQVRLGGKLVEKLAQILLDLGRTVKPGNTIPKDRTKVMNVQDLVEFQAMEVEEANGFTLQLALRLDKEFDWKIYSQKV